MIFSSSLKKSLIGQSLIAFGINACVLASPKSFTPKERSNGKWVKVEQAKEQDIYRGLGPLRKISKARTWYETEQDCPYGEWLFVSEIETNTFEMGLSWSLTQGRLTGERRLYTSYRCIPR